MNFQSSSWTGKAPRKMQQAFGCYVDNRLEPMPEPRKSLETVEIVLYAVYVLALVVVAFVVL